MFDQIQYFKMESAPIWAQLIDRLRWVELIDEFVDASEQCKLSIGTRIKALLINIGTNRRALYQVEKFYAQQDVEVLMGPGVCAEDLNDDALARALDAVYKADPEKLYSKLALSTALSLKVFDRFEDFIPVHADTTSVSVYGEYSDQSQSILAMQDPFQIARGYSKDGRPDLKQIIFGNVTVLGLPIYGTVDRGNMDDHTWNHNTITSLADVMTKDVQGKLVYIADSAAITEGNLSSFAGTKTQFISRLPSTFSLCEKLKRAAWEKENAWQDVGRLAEAKNGATYKIQAFHRELYGRMYRFVVVRSNSLDTRKEHKLEDVLPRERNELEKAAGVQFKTLYSCEQDAAAAAEAFSHAHRNKLHQVCTTLEAVQIREKRTKRGRPRKDEPTPPLTTQYRVRVEIQPPSEETLQAWREREATFVLITNIRDEQRLTNEAVLKLYKEQGEVEGRFRYLKSPYHVWPIYLHRVDRVKAFSYVMLLSLLLYSAFEFIIRENMSQEEEPLILPGKRKSFRPTGISVLEMFDGMITARVKIDGEWRYVKSTPPDPQIERVLKLLDMDLSIYYPVEKTA
ncbi:MAG: IS1634 family transposase [Alicyclobacillus sp.]|nr:IS1634 family transposase [Alicyclobacillus sp.]